MQCVVIVLRLMPLVAKLAYIHRCTQFLSSSFQASPLQTQLQHLSNASIDLPTRPLLILGAHTEFQRSSNSWKILEKHPVMVNLQEEASPVLPDTTKNLMLMIPFLDLPSELAVSLPFVDYNQTFQCSPRSKAQRSTVPLIYTSITNDIAFYSFELSNNKHQLKLLYSIGFVVQMFKAPNQDFFLSPHPILDFRRLSLSLKHSIITFSSIMYLL